MALIQKVLLGLLLVLVTIFSSMEIIEELSELKHNGKAWWSVSFEMLIVVASFCALLYFIFISYKQKREQKRLEKSLLNVRKNLERANVKLQKGKKEYLNIIQWQFKEWGLSPSEEEVALLMLKGLSIKEIAQGRSTHEKTVRKQASAVYEKTSLAGRHELSAWFFEDML
jgi:DNA-binding CsgD family transcriptional regulator